MKRLSLLVFILFYSIFVYADSKITRISVQNNHRIEAKTIESYLGLKVGDVFSDKAEIDSLKALYKTGFFENVSLKFNAGNLTITVEETPIIVEMSFQGNSKIKTNDLEKLFTIYKGDPYSQAMVEHDINQMTQLYNSVGRYLTKIDVEKQKIDSNRVKLIFKISEGPKTKIKTINFIGNNNFSSGILKKNIYTSESTWYSFMSTDDVYNVGRIEADIQMLKNFYGSKGYIDFKSISVTSELSKDKKYFTLVYNIEEGDKYYFNNVSIKSEIDGIKLDEKSTLKKIKSGSIYNRNLTDKAINEISEKLENEGYSEIEVLDELNRDSKNKTVDITFVIKKSSQIYIEKINITSNKKTHDKVIRRALDIYEGDRFSRRQIDRGIRRIRVLNFFEPDVKHNYEKSENNLDKYNLNIQVEEKSTASLGFNAGYSSVGGFFGNINFKEINLAGTGKHLDIAYSRSASTSSYNLGITEPYFFGTDISVGGRIFRKLSDDADFNGKKRPYSQYMIGFKPNIGYELLPDLYHSVDYLIQSGDIKLSTNTDKVIPKSVIEQAGKKITSSIISTLTFDRLDNRYFPKSGYSLSSTQEFAGLGGDIHFFKNEFATKYFYSFFEDRLTFKLSGEYGNIFALKNKTLRIIDRFSLGEPKLRGFEAEGVGPREIEMKDNKIVPEESLGGEQYYLVNAELIMPVKTEKNFNLSLLGFMDFGSLWGLDNIKKDDSIKNDNSIRASIGFGFILNTSIAPIRVDFGFPIKKEKYDKEQVISIGTSVNL